MATFQQTDTNNGLGVISACSGASAALTSFGKDAVVGGTAGSTGITPDIDSNSSQIAVVFELTPSDTRVEAGNWTVRLEVTKFGMDVNWSDTYICRVNSSGTNQETIGSLTGQTLALNGNGQHSQTVSGSQVDFDVGDKIIIVCVWTNLDTMMSNSSCEITPSNTITSPNFVAGVPNVDAAHISSTVSLFAPTITPDQVVTTSFISSGSQVFAPDVLPTATPQIIGSGRRIAANDRDSLHIYSGPGSGGFDVVWGAGAEGVSNDDSFGMWEAPSDPLSAAWTAHDNTTTGDENDDARVSVIKDGKIHRAYTENSVGSLFYMRWDIASKTWDTEQEIIINAQGGWSWAGIDMAVRDDGTVVIHYMGATETVNSSEYRRTYVTYGDDVNGWTTDVNVSPTGVENNFVSPGAILGEDDRVHLFWHSRETIDNRTGFRTLKADNTLSSAQTYDLSAGRLRGTREMASTIAAYVDSAGDLQMNRLVLEEDRTSIYLLNWSGSGDVLSAPSEELVADFTDLLEFSNLTVGIESNQIVALGETLHVIFPDTNNNLFYTSKDVGAGGSWSTPRYLGLTVSVSQASASIAAFVRGGQSVVAVAAWDGTNTNYTEITVDNDNQNIKTPTIPSGSSLFTSSVVVGAAQITASFISSGNQLFAPSTLPTPTEVTGAFISSGNQLSAPTVAVGAVEVVSSFISSGNQLFAPTAAAGAVEVTGAFVSSGNQLFAPTIDTGAVEVTGSFVSSGNQLFSPTIDTTVEVTSAFVSSGNQLFAPVVALGGQIVTASFISSGNQLFAPTIDTGAVEVTGAFVSSGSSLSVPTISSGAIEVTGAFISSANQLFAPSTDVGSVQVTSEFISSGNSLFVPSISLNIITPFISSNIQIFSPSLSYSQAVTSAFIASGNQIFVPTIGGTDSVRRHFGAGGGVYIVN